MGKVRVFDKYTSIVECVLGAIRWGLICDLTETSLYNEESTFIQLIFKYFGERIKCRPLRLDKRPDGNFAGTRVLARIVVTRGEYVFRHAAFVGWFLAVRSWDNSLWVSADFCTGDFFFRLVWRGIIRSSWYFAAGSRKLFQLWSSFQNAFGYWSKLVVMVCRFEDWLKTDALVLMLKIALLISAFGDKSGSASHWLPFCTFIDRKWHGLL